MRNEKHMEKKRIPVRPHHGMCLAYFIGKGYSEGFSAHMEKMLHILEQDVPIRLVVSLDEICSACPNHQFLTDEENSGETKEICEAQEKVFRYECYKRSPLFLWRPFLLLGLKGPWNCCRIALCQLTLTHYFYII